VTARNRKLLVVEDDRFWRTAISDGLTDAGYEVSTAAEGMSAIEMIQNDPPDLVVMDFYLPTVDANRLAEFIKESPELAQIKTVVLSSALVGTIDRDKLPNADAAIAKGPLLKTVPRLLEIIEDLLERHDTEKYRDIIIEPVPLKPRELTHKLYRLKQYVDALHENMGDVICEVDPNRRILRINPAGQALVGRPEHDLLGADVLEAFRLHPDSPIAQAIFGVLERDGDVKAGAADFTLGGRHLEATVARLYTAPDEPGVIIVARDITERTRTETILGETEKQLQHSMKMEAVGRLAGGVAHDFNNVLTTITGYAELMLGEANLSERMRSDLQEILDASERASTLTRQLLAFARRQIVRPRLCDLNQIVEGARRMLERVIGEDIELTVVSGDGLGRVMADPGQVEQIIMNLAVNARDAMPGGGKLTVVTSNRALDEAISRQSEVIEPGKYVTLMVSDTGVGMEEETMARVFEPFFSTKGESQGSGLGLSTVYGIVKQAGGHVTVASSPGEGTAITIYLPLLDSTEAMPASAMPNEAVLQGTETVLLVEDEALLLSLMSRTLEAYGYKVLKAANGSQALEVAEVHSGTIDLLITDVVMPKMGGRELAERVGELIPGIKLLYISGYVGDDAPPGGAKALPEPLLPKPFAPQDLAAKVRELLDSRSPTH